MIQYNKLYQSLKKVSAEWHAGHVQWEYSWYYFKFFEDGTFIYTSIAEDNKDEINSWFKKDINDVLRGTFSLNRADHIIITFENGIQTNGALTKENQLIVQGKLAWDLFTLS